MGQGHERTEGHRRAFGELRPADRPGGLKRYPD